MAAERYLSRRIPDLRVGNNIDEIDKKLIPASIHPCLNIAGSRSLMITCLTHKRFATRNTILRKRLADIVMQHSKLNVADFSYCVSLRAPRKNQLPSMTSKRYHHLIKILMLIGVSIQQRISLQIYHSLTM